MTVICGASTAGKSTQPAGKSTQPAQAWLRASLEGWTAPRRGERARQHRSGRCRGRRGKPSASCREFPSGRGSDKRTASTPTDACQRSSRVRREAEADGFTRGRNESRYPELIHMCVVALHGMLREAEHFRCSAQSPLISIYGLTTSNTVSSASTWPFGSMYDTALAI